MNRVLEEIPSNVTAATAKANRLAFVDALRGLAVIGVILAHTTIAFPHLPGRVADYTWNGSMGVQLFYVASAFTLFLSLRNRKRFEHNPIRNFFIRRFFRIAPLFYLGMVLVWLADGFGPRAGVLHGISTANIVADILFLHGLSPYWINSIVPGGWSIAVEVMFYIFVPFLYARIRSFSAALWWTLISFAVATPISLLAEHQMSKSCDKMLVHHYVYFWFPMQLSVFCLGILFYHLYLSIENASPAAASIGDRKSLSSYLLFASLVLMVALHGTGDSVVPHHFLYGIAFVTLALSLALHPFKFIVNKVICYVGTVSYSCYITHFFVLRGMEKLLRPLGILNCSGPLSVCWLLLVFVVAIALTVGVSTITYRLVELPGQAIGRRIIAARERA